MLLLVSALLVGACGFQLRGEFKYAFATIYLNSPAGSSMVLDVKRAIEASGGARVVDSAVAAEVILDLPLPIDDKAVLSLSAGGRVAEFSLTKRVSFRLHDASGRDWLQAADLAIRRTYTFSESEVLAREAQEVRLLKEMQGDAVQQIVRRLQAAKAPS
jgi:LPS-assembly lipoprotein